MNRAICVVLSCMLSYRNGLMLLRALLVALFAFHSHWLLIAQDALTQRASDAIRKSARFYHENASSHGGYVYHYSLDLKRRWGEGEATIDQVWVQPPGTPTVGMAFLEAYDATGDESYLNYANDAARAIVYGQLRSGGWTNAIDFDPNGQRTANYRNGRGRGKNNSSLDDGQTQSAIQLLVRVDKALGFRDMTIHQAAITGLDALLAAQFPNGGFPQVWTRPVEPQPIRNANFPPHDWRSEGRIKNYWDMYTLNDNVTGYVADTLIDAHRVYEDERYIAALRNLGDFLLRAQMPEPQPGWAQQYNYDMQPIWARKFEPPGVSGDETQEVLATLMTIADATGDQRYLIPIPAALSWLRRSTLPDGQLARYYELKTNRPLYMNRRGDTYSLTYNDTDLPKHYGWKTPSRLKQLRDQYAALRNSNGGPGSGGQPNPSPPVDRSVVEVLLTELDDHGRWVSEFDGQRVIGQLKLPLGTRYLSSQVFSDNLRILSEFVKQQRRDDPQL